MKKSIAMILIFAILLLHTIDIKTVSALEDVWDIYITNISQENELVTDESVTLYTGDIQIVTHTDTANDSNVFLMLNLYVNKTKTDTSVFNVSNASIVVGSGVEIQQIDSGFLSNHDKTPFSKNDVRFGESDGWIVFEIDENLDLSDAVLKINGIELDLQVIKITKSNDETNINITENIMEQQWEIEKQLLADYNQSTYDLQNPYVILDPYNWAPLSALALFESDKPARVSVEVLGKDVYSTITHDFDEYNAFHQVPILGLYPDYTNTVTVTLTYEDGVVESSSFDVVTEPLVYDIDMVSIKLIKAQPDKMQDGLTYLGSESVRPIGIDCNADIRWILNRSMSQVFKRLENGNFMVKFSGQSFEVDPVGKIYMVYSSLQSMHHDMIQLPNGNILTCSSAPNIPTGNGARILELDAITGEIVNEINFEDILDNTRFNPDLKSHDWFHINTLVYNDDEKTLMVSGRNQGVAKITYPDGKLIWFTTLGLELDAFENEYLTPIGENFKAAVSQHSPEYMSDQDGNPDTIDILLFDNNSPSISIPAYEGKGEYSRVVQYRINEKEMTIEQIWDFGQELGYEYYSSKCGDADYLENGTVLCSFGARNHTIEVSENQFHIGTIIEIDYFTQEVLYEIDVKFEDCTTIYRSERLPLYPQNWEFSLLSQKGEVKARNNYETMQTDIEFVDVNL